MTEKNENAAAVRKRIEEAFADARYPGDDNLISHECDECFQLADAFKGTHWRDWSDKPVEDIRLLNDLPLFTPEAFAFFLPVFMIATLRDYEEADLIPGSIMFNLSPMADDQREDAAVAQDYLESLRQLWTPSQKSAVRSFLEFLKREHPDEDEVDPALRFLGDQ